MEENFDEINEKLFELLSIYLNFDSNAIKPNMVKKMMIDFGLKEDDAVRLLVASRMGLDIVDNDEDKLVFNSYFKKMLKKLDPNVYRQNPYYTSIKFNNLKLGNIEFKEEKYEPYELFVYNNLEKFDNGQIIPPIGYFDEEFVYPTILENGQNWMSITPNEIETMKDDIFAAHGRVLTFGLGLGYYAYMVSQKHNVEEVTIVDINDSEIKLFKEFILPQFEFKDKIKIIKADAFEFAKTYYSKKIYDSVYVDIWRDAGDGIPIYKQMKELEKLNPQADYRYWIEKTMLCYM